MRLTRRRIRVAVAVAGAATVTTALAALTVPSGWASTSPARPDTLAGQSLYLYQVPAAGEDSAQRLIQAGFDVVERRSGNTLYVLGDEATRARLRGAGFTPTGRTTVSDGARTQARAAEADAVAAAPIDETYYGGYHTVQAQLAHLDSVATAHPDLATVVDYGDSYIKTTKPSSGRDLKAICVTHRASGDCALNPSAPKPRFLLTAQTHAREIVTGDMAWRFIDHLVGGYGTNQAVTRLLDSTEVWVIPIVNPDGVETVQKGGSQPYLQRKNMHGTGCSNPPTSSSQVGVDLNRNTSWKWNTTGVSSKACDQAYPGAKANSEPETVAIQGLLRKLFPDQRGSQDTDAVPATARGTMLTLHSYSGLILFPWAAVSTRSPNDAKLRAMAAAMSQYNGYDYGQPGELLYNASGSVDDWAYGELGLASFTIEAASCDSFTPAYSCATTDYNANLPAIMYLAGKASSPYA